MNLRQLRIGTRLAVGFGVILITMIVLVLGGTTVSTKNRQQIMAGVHQSQDSVALAMAMKTNMLESALALRNIGLQSDLGEMEKLKNIIKEKRALYVEARDKLVAAGLDEQQKKALEDINNLDQQADGPTKEAFKMLVSFNGEEAVKVITTQIDPLQQKMLVEINRFVELQNQAAVGFEASWNAKAMKTVYVLIGFSVLIVVAGVAFSLFLTRSITQPLQEAVGIAQRVAAGELSQLESSDGADEISTLLNALKDMNDNLYRIVSEVRQSTDTITVAASEISTGNSDLSSRTENQAGALEETASSMEEITATVRHNADNARQANGLVTSASNFAIKGGEEVSKVVDTMNSIKESSRKIVDIISVIDGIAFQTNILALNAAVEAARAGEQGRGFAVVASEVRNLAQRSASAAKEIKVLINDSVSTVEAGGKLVDTAGQTMNEIVGSVKHVADIMAEITAAGLEQSSGIEEVNRAITQMDEMTQQNAALVEQAAAAAESLEEQANHLAEVVSAFKLSNTTVRSDAFRYSAAASDNADSGDSLTSRLAGRMMAALTMKKE